MHTKAVLAEFIYKLNEANRFKCQKVRWSSPQVGFDFNHSLLEKFMKELKKSNIISEGTSNIICILGDWDCVAEGIIFTDRAMYVNSPKNSDKMFKVRYDEINDLNYYSPFYLQIKTGKKTFYLDTDIWSKRNVYDFLQFARGYYDFNSVNKQKIENIILKNCNGESVGVIAAGLTYSNISNASLLYNEDKLQTPRGHGFAAEQANHLVDMYLGKDSQLVGNDNIKNGADRIVDGNQLQSKYCASGSKCIQECFDNGNFKYWNPDGTPMIIEVPSDMYDSAVQAMENRIESGQVKGVTNPEEAKNLIRKGHFTYTQVKNIAKAGTVESITYDAASGAIIAKIGRAHV